MPPIPPYEYPESPPAARSAPGDSPEPEQPKKSKPELKRPLHGPPPPKPFIERVSPITPVVPEKQPVQQVVMSHPETVTLSPVQEVVRQPEPSKSSTPEPSKILTPVKEKPLTNVKQKPDEKINGNLSNKHKGDNSSLKNPLISSPAPTAKKLPKKMQFKGKKGRQRTEAEVRDLLTFVQNRNGAWPNDNYVSEQMRRYYKREYPEYFRKAKGKKVHAARSAPIDMASRRAGNA